MKAARKLQLAQLAKLAETRSFIDSTQHLYPGIAAEVMSIYTCGDDPKYEACPPKAVPADC